MKLLEYIRKILQKTWAVVDKATSLLGFCSWKDGVYFKPRLEKKSIEKQISLQLPGVNDRSCA